MSVPGITASQLFVYARDAALFKALFFSGDRANDLTLVKTQEIMRFPEKDGLLFNHVWGKSLRDGSANLFGIRRHSDLSLCLVKAIELYVAISSELSVDLLAGHLFRPLSSTGRSKISKSLTLLCSHDSVAIYRKQRFTVEKLCTALGPA